MQTFTITLEKNIVRAGANNPVLLAKFSFLLYDDGMDHMVGFIGLGRMGQNMVLHMLEQGIKVAVYNRTRERTEEFQSRLPRFFANHPTGVNPIITFDIGELVRQLPEPRIIWLMVAAGEPVDEVIRQLRGAGLNAGDVIVDGGNSFYKATINREQDLREKEIILLDVGVSGGLDGARHGACLMIGGREETVKNLIWLWDALSVPGGWTHFGASGAGHFVKMVHNAIEYGMNQSLAEGFAMLEKGHYPLDLHKVAQNWNHGSIIGGKLVELLGRAFEKDPLLDGYEGHIGGGETGQWALETAKEIGVATSVVEKALEARKISREHPSFAAKVVSALRFEYGGHKEKKE